MKIAFFTEGYDPFVNGVVTSVKTLGSALERQGHEVVIFAPAYGGHRDDDPKVVRLPSVRWSKAHYPSLSPFARNLDVLAGEGFELVHSHHPFTMGQLAVRLARKHGLPLIYSVHRQRSWDRVGGEVSYTSGVPALVSLHGPTTLR